MWKSEFHSKGFIASSSDDLKGYFELALSKGIEVVIQEMIIGPNKNHFKVCAYYSKDKNLMAMFSTQKTRQVPVDFGTGSFMASVNSPELIALGRRFFEGMGYTGVGSIEFKLDDRDARFRIIELNPRFWVQNIQATYAGVNFPYINYLDCTGGKVVPSLDFKENICWLNAFEDLASFIGNRKRGDVSLFSG
ncbi:MAG: hypothetical protein GY845_07880 [Planctomycetes bacterium]|nr:hypothetical protein [Planctomycetota bacterium]